MNTGHGLILIRSNCSEKKSINGLVKLPLSVFIPAVAGVFLLPLVSDAQLGLTPAQCEVKYGKAVGLGDIGGNSARYVREGLEFSIQFSGGRAGQVSITRQDGAALTPVQINQLLAEAAEGSSWQKIAPRTDEQNWMRTDRKAFAAYRQFEKTLVLTSTGMRGLFGLGG